MTYVSPYAGLPVSQWSKRTAELLEAYPLTGKQIAEPILEAWDSIFESKIGRHGIQIGKEIFPSAQVMASYLHVMIPLEFAAIYPGVWRSDQTASEKDLVYIPDDAFSAEIKASSSAKKIFGNRSYAQEATSLKKNKNGYYLAVNFEKFASDRTTPQRPRIRLIRFGWLDHSDWKGQDKPTGQNASLLSESDQGKLIAVYKA